MLYCPQSKIETTLRVYRRYGMRDFDIEKEMYHQAAALIEKRYPTGWAGRESCIRRTDIILPVSALTQQMRRLFCVSRRVRCWKRINITKELHIVCAWFGMMKTLLIKSCPRVGYARNACGFGERMCRWQLPQMIIPCNLSL